MNYKPSDFFIGVIDLFGILVPGAVLLFLHGESLAKPLALSLDHQQTALLVAFSIGSYVLGHFLLGIGVPLNRTLCVFRPEGKDDFYKAIKDTIDLPRGVAKTRTNVFYRAYALVRLESPSALTEIERQMADYKLFRSLTVIFGLDLVLTAIVGAPHWSRWLFSGTLFVVAAWRFLFLLGWTYRITFEYYALIKSSRQ